MALIKSALELALEKTADIKSDKASIEKKKLKEEGKKLASRLFDSLEDLNIEEIITTELKKHKKDQQNLVLEGLNSTALLNIQIPSDFNDVFKHRLEVTGRILLHNAKNQKNMAMMLQQFKDFIENYFQHIEQLKNQLKAQIMPLVQQKQAELQEKLGQEVHITPEQLPEYAEALKQNIDHMNQQYKEMLDKVKEEMSALIA